MYLHVTIRNIQPTHVQNVHVYDWPSLSAVVGMLFLPVAGYGMHWLPGQQYGMPPVLAGLDSDLEPHPSPPPWSHHHSL